MKRTVLLAATAAIAALGLASIAQADVVGQTGANVGCATDLLLVQQASASISYVFPTSGVVSSWSFDGGPTGSTEGLVILRPAGGNAYTVVGSTPAQTLAANTVATFPTNIAVQAGDIVGEWAHASNSCALQTSGDSLYYGFVSSTQTLAGNSVTLSNAAGSYLLNMSVVFNDGSHQVTRAGYCSAAGNTDALGRALATGTFLNLATDQPETDAHVKGVTPAFYYQGLGISCDALPGYSKTGEMVGYGGHGDPGAYTYMAKS